MSANELRHLNYPTQYVPVSKSITVLSWSVGSWQISAENAKPVIQIPFIHYELVRLNLLSYHGTRQLVSHLILFFSVAMEEWNSSCFLVTMFLALVEFLLEDIILATAPFFSF